MAMIIKARFAETNGTYAMTALYKYPSFGFYVLGIDPQIEHRLPASGHRHFHLHSSKL